MTRLAQLPRESILGKVADYNRAEHDSDQQTQERETAHTGIPSAHFRKRNRKNLKEKIQYPVYQTHVHSNQQ